MYAAAGSGLSGPDVQASGAVSINMATLPRYAPTASASQVHHFMRRW